MYIHQNICLLYTLTISMYHWMQGFVFFLIIHPECATENILKTDDIFIFFCLIYFYLSLTCFHISFLLVPFHSMFFFIFLKFHFWCMSGYLHCVQKKMYKMDFILLLFSVLFPIFFIYIYLYIICCDSFSSRVFH